MLWSAIVFFGLGLGGIAVYMRWQRHIRRYLIAVGVLIVQWLVLGPHYSALIVQNIPQPEAPNITLPSGFAPGVSGITGPMGVDSTAPAEPPTATPIPEPLLLPGTEWYDKPVADDNGPPKKIPGLVGNKPFKIVGRYGDLPFDPLCFCIQVQVDGESWWVWQAALPMNDQELMFAFNQGTEDVNDDVPNRKPPTP